MLAAVERWLLYAPATVECAIAAVPGVLGCVGASVPGGYFTLIVLAFGATMVMLAWWLVRVFAATVIGWRWGRLPAALRQPGWVAMPTVLVAVGALAFTSIPIRSVRWFEEGRLQGAVRQALAAEASGADTPTISGITVDFALLPGTGRVSPEALEQLREWRRASHPEGSPDWTEGGVAITVPETGFLFEVGVYFFLPNLTPQPGDPPIPTTILQPIGDGWFEGRLHFP